jgi:hypothetical protein
MTTTRYSKPEILLLGKAARVVQLLGKCAPGAGETPFIHFDPAYDLDD